MSQWTGGCCKSLPVRVFRKLQGWRGPRPLAVVTLSMGQYGGVWAHDEARKSFGIAAADVVDALAFSLPIDTLGA